MPESRKEGWLKRPHPGAGITRFPSADLWQDPWEPNFDLFALRRKRKKLDDAYALAGKLKPDLEIGIPKASAVETLVASLELSQESAMQLAEDTFLLAKWYFLPELGKQIAIGRETMLDQLKQAGQYADSLYALMGGIAPQVEELAGDLNLSLPMCSDGRSLMSFADDIGKMGHVARDILRVARPRVRPRESRRNHAIVLASHAVEDACGVRIETSRDTKLKDGEHFTNAPGRFLAGIMRMLARSSESVVAGRFKEMRQPLA